MDKVREEFEKWAKQFFKLEVEDWGEYVESETQWAWLAWKASRESIVVDLPRCQYEEQQEYLDDLLNSLDKVGVRYE